MILASEKLDKVQRWKKYILVAIDEVEKEIIEKAEVNKSEGNVRI